MIRVEVIEGGWGCACNVDGDWIAQLDWSQDLDTGAWQHTHPTAVRASWVDGVLLPSDQLRFPDIASDGSRRFAGIIDGDQALEFDGTTFVNRGLAFGPFGLIYDRDGALRRVPQTPAGAYGYRAVADDGMLITAESTQLDQGDGLYGWTDLGDDLKIGIDRDNTGIYLVQAGERRRQLRAGPYLDVRVKWRRAADAADDYFAISAYATGTPSHSVLIWAHRRELLSIPVEVDAPLVIPAIEPPAFPRMLENVNVALVGNIWRTILTGRPLAAWCYTENREDEIEAVLAEAPADLPRIVYFKTQALAAQLAPQVCDPLRDIISFPVYRERAEPLDAFAARTFDLIGQLDNMRPWGFFVFPILGFYTRGITAALLTPQEVLDCLPFYADVLSDPVVIGAGTFGVGKGRRDGDGAYPIFGDAVALLGSALRGLPDLSVVLAPPPAPEPPPSPAPPAPPTSPAPERPTPPTRRPRIPMTDEQKKLNHAYAVKAMKALNLNNVDGFADEVRGDFERLSEGLIAPRFADYLAFVQLKNKRPDRNVDLGAFDAFNTMVDELVRGSLQ